MEEKLVTIVVLPYSKAHILKMRLKARGVECVLEDIHFIEGMASSTVRVKILEEDVQKAHPVLEEFLGTEAVTEEPGKERMEKHILVPVDFSLSSEKACKMAWNIAVHLKVKLVVMHNYVNPLIHSIPYSDVYAYDSALLMKVEYAEKHANENFQEFISKIADEIGAENWESVSPEYIIKSGYAENDILSFSSKNQSRLVVMGSGGSIESGGTVGSVAADVMYNARVPVLIVPEDTPEQELKEISTVLYATNFDEKDFTILDKLMTLLQPFETRVVCAHVGQPAADGWDLARLDGMRDILHDKYKEKRFECQLIVGKDVLQSLEHFIKEHKVDLITLTTHKRSMISRLFNPSLAKKMVFHTHTPLLVFHA